MDYVSKLSLKHAALTKIAIALWNQHVVRTPTMLLEDMDPYAGYKNAEEKAIENVSGLLLPESLKRKVVKFIGGIGQEMVKWREHLCDNYDLDIALPSELFWTSLGTVDTKRTAEAFVQNETIDVALRYKLACDYCLEDDVPKLWAKMPKNFREQQVVDSCVRWGNMVVYWTCLLNGIVGVLRNGWISSPSQYVFEFAVRHSHKAATEYFFQRLTREEREALLMRSAIYLASEVSHSFYVPSHDSDIFCFLLSQMNESEQIETFKVCPSGVLRCLLEWPWQSVFMKTANRMWDFLSGKNFNNILLQILKKRGHKDCDYQKLFVEFWHQSSNAHKKYVIDRDETVSILLYELFSEGTENVRLILKSANVERRKKILFSNQGKAVCYSLFEKSKWDSLKLLLQECLLSKEVMIQFNGEFKALTIANGGQERVWNEFIGSLLDDLNLDNSRKRCAEETGGSTKVKRLHSS